MKKNARKIVSVILAVILAFSAAVGTFAVSDMIAEDTKTKAVRIAKQIQAEGTVLIENKDSLLPLANKKVSVFGIKSFTVAGSRLPLLLYVLCIWPACEVFCS